MAAFETPTSMNSAVDVPVIPVVAVVIAAADPLTDADPDIDTSASAIPAPTPLTALAPIIAPAESAVLAPSQET